MADDADLAGDLIELASANNILLLRAAVTGKGQEYCEDCGEGLSPARREAAPWAIRCVPCASVYEQKQTHRR
jgi:RNA polymerase-binding transcription factor DksA